MAIYITAFNVIVWTTLTIIIIRTKEEDALYYKWMYLLMYICYMITIFGDIIARKG